MNFVPLNANEHTGLKIKPGLNEAFVGKRNACPIILQETFIAASELPTVFIKSKEGEKEQYVLAALLGMRNEENAYIQGDKPRGNYVPFMLTHHPLAITINPENRDQFAVLIDKDSPLVSESEGEALFDGDKNTKFLEGRVQALSNYQKGADFTKQFVETIVELDLLTPRSIAYEVNGEKRSAGEFFVIDEQKLNDLPDEKFIELRKKAFLPAIYAHFVSLNQFYRLIKWANE